jgi:Spy/CpxP family protein refolding chaperone
MKRRMAVLIFIVSLVCLGGIGTIAHAQGQGMHWGRDKEQRARNLENLRMLKLLELLDLDSGQNEKFISMFADFRKRDREITDNIRVEIDSLADLLRSENPREEAIRDRIDRIEALRRQQDQNSRAFHEDVMKVLTLEQAGKMIVFEERFERELLETVRGFREKYPPPDIGP